MFIMTSLLFETYKVTVQNFYSKLYNFIPNQIFVEGKIHFIFMKVYWFLTFKLLLPNAFLAPLVIYLSTLFFDKTNKVVVVYLDNRVRFS